MRERRVCVCIRESERGEGKVICTSFGLLVNHNLLHNMYSL